MTASLERVRARLDAADVRSFDARGAGRVHAALAGREAAAHLVQESARGGVTVFLPGSPRRRFLELDRDAGLVTALRWNDRGSLGAASIRSAYGDWIGVEPRATHHVMWGESDRLWWLGDGWGAPSREPLTEFEALDWASIAHIPPLANPARLPPGAGTAVLNLIATLARDQGTARLRYRGPYATEQLFTALLESFRFVADRDPLRHFLDGALEWEPAPHERRFPAAGVCVQLRDGVEKVVLDGRAYYRLDWQSVRRHAQRRLHDTGGATVCSLWALGLPVEDHAIVSEGGDVLARIPPTSDSRAPDLLNPAIRQGIEAVLCAQSAPQLGAELRAALATLTIEWGSVSGDLVEVTGSQARLGWRLADVGAARIRAARSAAERLGRALELVVEAARLLGDAIRARAQAALAARPPVAQHAALGLDRLNVETATAPPPPATDDSARTIALAAQALADQLDPGGRSVVDAERQGTGRSWRRGASEKYARRSRR
jgi:hypothetical protein